MREDEKCTCGLPCFPVCLALNRNNSEMILPVVRCSLLANWTGGLCSQEAIFETGWEMDSSPCTPHVIHFEKLQIPSSEGKQEKTPRFCLNSVNHTPTLTAQETEGELWSMDQWSVPCSVRNNSSRNSTLLAFTSLAASSVGTRRHTAYKQTQARMFF